MKVSLKLEYFSLFLIFFYGFVLQLDNNFLLALILLFIPDLGMVGYIVNTKVGAVTYNVLHHHAIGVLFLAIGWFGQADVLVTVGLLLLAHSFMDRMLGYGLKYPDSFKHTHLGDLSEGIPTPS